MFTTIVISALNFVIKIFIEIMNKHTPLHSQDQQYSPYRANFYVII